MNRLQTCALTGGWDVEPIEHRHDDEAGVGDCDDSLPSEPLGESIEGCPDPRNKLRPTLTTWCKGTVGIRLEIEDAESGPIFLPRETIGCAGVQLTEIAIGLDRWNRQT